MRKYILLLALLCACACSPKPRLVIIHTNDTHSHYEPLRSGKYEGLGGVVERAAFVDSVRNVYGKDKVLLLHAGDFSQGSIYFSELDGEFEPLIINDLGYDCVTLGNHEFDNDLENLTGRLKRFDNTAVVCSNIDISQFELANYVKPYAVIERAGMRIGFIGLLPNVKSYISASVSSRFEQINTLESANKWAGYLHNEEKVDMVILLSHLGYEDDMSLVPDTQYIDLVIGGHTHSKVDDIVYVLDKDGKEVPIITDWYWGLEMGLLKIY